MLFGVEVGDGESKDPLFSTSQYDTNFWDAWMSGAGQQRQEGSKWKAFPEAMLGFLGKAEAGDVLIFTPELLSGKYCYARKFSGKPGTLIEETDRYRQALLYQDLAKSCFAEAKRLHRTSQIVDRGAGK